MVRPPAGLLRAAQQSTAASGVVARGGDRDHRAMTHDTLPDPFHSGEHALQRLAGMRERIAEVGARMVREQMPDQHRELFGKLPFVLIGSVDDAGWPQASLLAGPPGFVHTPDARTLAIDAVPHPADPLARALRVGASIGVLGIEPHTRRRNRLNGIVAARRADGFEIAVQQSFGNCPKYIQARQARWVDGQAAREVRVTQADRLDDAARALIRGADTYFIASSVPPEQLGARAAHGVDVSHRGGRPGFVRVERGEDGTDTLTVPDFAGNNLFNTLGNLTVHPRAGLLFVDFATPALVQLSVDSEIVSAGPDVAAFAGALRVLRHRVRHMRRFEGLPALTWGAAQLSPFLQATGHWQAAR
jgi:predicted pyridoxine 5'-phosphate oxidase superfamily flavin-nucleotide-binding protein